jgi:uncharacterized RDD family membrane protein YckC
MQTICAECGGVFPVEDTIHYGKVDVCSGCKPVFMQKLAEGAAVKTGEFQYAGFWIRFLAVFVDGLIYGVIQGITVLAMGFNTRQLIGLQSKGSVGATVGFYAVQYTIVALYEILLVGRYGATFGKMACGLRVIRENGKPVSMALSTGRYFAKFFLGLPTLYIGYIIAAFDIEKRTLHDRICSTRVVRK